MCCFLRFVIISALLLSIFSGQLAQTMQFTELVGRTDSRQREGHLSHVQSAVWHQGLRPSRGLVQGQSHQCTDEPGGQFGEGAIGGAHEVQGAGPEEPASRQSREVQLGLGGESVQDHVDVVGSCETEGERLDAQL